MKKVLLLTIMLIIASTVCPAEGSQKDSEPNRPTAKELLKRYAETQDKFQSSFISKEEISTQTEAFLKDRPEYKKGQIYKSNYNFEFRTDGKKFSTSSKRWGDNASYPSTPENRPAIRHSLWDGDAFYQYNAPSINYPDKRDSLVLSPKEKFAKPATNVQVLGGGVGKMRGFFYGGSGSVRIDKELEKIQNLTVLPKKEVINNSACYVITAKTNDSEFKIWIDPEHGFNIARAVIERKYISAVPPKESMSRTAIESGTSKQEIKNVQFKQVDGVWMPVEADYNLNIKTISGGYEIDKEHYKITEFKINPDHEGLGSFNKDFIKNGAEVNVVGVPRIRYIWQDGKVVDKNGKVIMDLTEKKQENLKK